MAVWKGVIEAGSQSEAVAGAIDYLPTIANLAGIELPNDRHFDGIDLENVFKGSDKNGH